MLSRKPRPATGDGREGRVAAVRGGHTTSAAHLYGAASALRNTMGVPLPPTERVYHEHIVAAVRANLNETAFANAWAEGQAMPLEQAVAAALQVREQFTPPQESPTVLAFPAISQAGASRTNLFGLTAREIEVLHLVSLGLTDAQIADSLAIDQESVQ